MKRASVVSLLCSIAASTFAALLSAIRSSAASLREAQPVEVGRRVHDARIHQLVDQLVAQALDVERAAAGEVQQRLLALRRADEPARAARDDFARQAHDGRPALRARGRHRERLRAGGPPVGHDADHLRDHVARAADDHRVADAQVAPADLVLVVERHVGHRRAADEHRAQPRDRRDRARASDLHVDREELRRHLLRRKLVRDGPARLARAETELGAAARGRRPCTRRRRSRTGVHRGAPAPPRRTQRARRRRARPGGRRSPARRTRRARAAARPAWAAAPSPRSRRCRTRRNAADAAS